MAEATPRLPILPSLEMTSQSGITEAGRTLALETVVQWLVFEAVRKSDDQRAHLASLLEHLQAQRRLVDEYEMSARALGSLSGLMQAFSASLALDEMRESLADTVRFDP